MKNKIEEGKKLLIEFEETIGMTKLRSLSNVSLERPLTENEFQEIMELKNKYLEIRK